MVVVVARSRLVVFVLFFMGVGVDKLNALLQRCSYSRKLNDLSECDASVFISLYERILSERVPGIIAVPRCQKDDIHNVQSLIDSLSLDYLQISLSHITGESVVHGDHEAIKNLLEIFEGLLDYLTADNGNNENEVEEDLAAVRAPQRDNTNQGKASEGCSTSSSSSAKILVPIGESEGTESTEELIRLGQMVQTFPSCSTDYHGSDSTSLSEHTLASEESLFDLPGHFHPVTTQAISHGVLPSAILLQPPLQGRSAPSGLGEFLPTGSQWRGDRVQRIAEKTKKTVSFLPAWEPEQVHLPCSPVPGSPAGSTSLPQSSPSGHQTSVVSPSADGSAYLIDPLSQCREHNIRSELELQRMAEQLAWQFNKKKQMMERTLRLDQGSPSKSSTVVEDDRQLSPHVEAEDSSVVQVSSSSSIPSVHRKTSRRKLRLNQPQQQCQATRNVPLSPLPQMELSKGNKTQNECDIAEEQNGFRMLEVQDATETLRRLSLHEERGKEKLQKAIPVEPSRKFISARSTPIKMAAAPHDVHKAPHSAPSTPRSRRSLQETVPPCTINIVRKSHNQSSVSTTVPRGVTRSKMPCPKPDRGGDLLTVIMEEFPGLQLSPRTLNRTWQQQMRHLQYLAQIAARPDRTQVKLEHELDEMKRKHDLLVRIIRKEHEHNSRLRGVQDQVRLQRQVRRNEREGRQRGIRARQYHRDYFLQLRAKMLRARSREEKMFRNIFEDGLHVQKARLLEMRALAQEKRHEEQQRWNTDLLSMENYYKDRFTMLAESVANERNEIEIQGKAQAVAVKKHKREIQDKMEEEVQQLQEQILRQDNVAFYRELESERFRRELKMVSFQYRKTHLL
uniref:centrosomal protein of 95 kDa-like isoform X1 n=1 Tax=Myxine glutinosa TaxID=7769 RepID=UPI00358EE4E1